MNTSRLVDGVKRGKDFFIPFARNTKGKVSVSFDDVEIRDKKYRLRNPIQPNTADIVNWLLYDRITFAAGTTVPNLVRLFVAPIGSGAKTKVDTNLEQVSRLPDPQWFNTTGVGFYFNPNAAPADVDSFLATEYMEFWVSQKVYLEGPMQCFPGAAGVNITAVSLATPPVAGNYVDNIVNGWPSVHNLYDVRLPAGLNLGINDQGTMVTADGLIGVTILQGQSFHVELKADGGGATLVAATGVTPINGTGLTVSSYLHGILSRGVQ